MRLSKLVLGALLGATGVTQAATPLVDTAWVKENGCAENVRLLDIRNGIDGGSKTVYLRGHLPCAVYTDYLKDGWRKEVDKVVGQLPPTGDLEKLIGGLGIDNDTHVVVYHAGKNAVDMGSATRVYWTFKVLGHDEVSILDGGFAAYAGEKGNEIEKGKGTEVEAKTFKASLREEMLVSKEDVAKVLDKDVALVDLRPQHQHVGINHHPKAKRVGTIPGSKNLPESWLTQNGGGKFRSAEALSKLFAAADVPSTGEQVHFCNTGHWASLGWFASSELMGNKDSKLYDGSMVDWAGDESMPMEVKVTLE